MLNLPSILEVAEYSPNTHGFQKKAYKKTAAQIMKLFSNLEILCLWSTTFAENLLANPVHKVLKIS